MPVNNIKLEIGCGAHKAEGWIGIDKQPFPGVDLPWDLENIPWPLPDECAYYIRGIHVMEHICPKKQIAVMNELWRVCQVGRVLELNVPLAGSQADFWNPEHCAHFTMRSWELFDPRFPWYAFYTPRPWRIEDGYPRVSSEGTIGVMLTKVREGDVILV